MKVKLTTNLGTRDLAHYGLDHGLKGEVVDVKDKVGAELIKKGLAVKEDGDKAAGAAAHPAAHPPDAPQKIHAVPPVDLKTAPATKPLPGK